MNAVSELTWVGPSANHSNPFCTRFVRPGALKFCFDHHDGVDDDGDAASGMIEQLVASRFGLIVGRHGSGKSTLIQTLLPMLSHRFCEVRTIQTHASTVPGLPARLASRMKAASAVMDEAKRLERGGLMIVDGIEQLGVVSRYRLLLLAQRNRQFILATSHRRLSLFATLFRTQVTADLIADLANRLLADAPSDLVSTIDRELQSRRVTTLGNVRELWFDLYDVAETWRIHLCKNQKERA